LYVAPPIKKLQKLLKSLKIIPQIIFCFQIIRRNQARLQIDLPPKMRLDFRSLCGGMLDICLRGMTGAVKPDMACRGGAGCGVPGGRGVRRVGAAQGEGKEAWRASFGESGQGLQRKPAKVENDGKGQAQHACWTWIIHWPRTPPASGAFRRSRPRARLEAK
jgi:hypothetical protein